MGAEAGVGRWIGLELGLGQGDRKKRRGKGARQLLGCRQC